MAETNPASPVIALPSGGGAVRGIGETFAPDLHTGTVAGQVPIELPPARRGTAPQLTLTYSSAAGNGPFGAGWTVQVPRITRRTARGVPRYNEAVSPDALAARWERPDVFVLSGGEELVRVGGGLPGTIRYRPRTEGLFAIVEHERRPDAGVDAWLVHTKDGLVSRYGGDQAAVVDPGAPGRIFAWCLRETEDPFGNRIHYDYRRDGAQLHPSLIRYVEIPEPDTGPQYLVSVAFEYTDRPDPRSDSRAGFEVRTTLRCTAIVIRTHSGADREIRRYALGYEQAANGMSLLTSVTVSGVDASGARESMPPLEFRYEPFAPDHRRLVAATGPELPTQSLATPDFAVIDLAGSGLPDLLHLDGTGRYWRNLGGGKFDRPREMPDVPTTARLSDPDVQLLDADGDGRTDLLVGSDGLVGYFPMRFGAVWDRRSLVRYAQTPAVDLADPEVRLVDLDGDAVTDVLRTGSRFECFFNDRDPVAAWRRTAAIARQGADQFPDVSFADPRVRLADLTGDGLSDIVLVHDRSVAYWPNLGHGRFGARRSMVDSPQLPFGYDPRRLLFGDVDGDGLADLVYVDDGQVTVWLNRSGNGWAAPVTLTGTPRTPIEDVRLVDLLGSGVAGLLFSRDTDGSRPSLHHLDLTGGRKPYLLAGVTNNLGSSTEIEYRPSTADYLRDLPDPAIRWRTPLPFPVQVAGRTVVTDHISGRRMTSRFAYHQGYWDGEEQEFRGFATVDEVDSDQPAPPADGPSPAPGQAPVLTRTWFHQGPVEDGRGGWRSPDHTASFWSDDPQVLGQDGYDAATGGLLAALPPRVRRDALRALRGAVLRTELYALDGGAYQDRPYTVTETCHAVAAVVDDPEGPRLVTEATDLPDAWHAEPATVRVFFPHVVASRTTEWERADDPLSRFTFTAAFDALGRPHHQTAVAAPRRSARRRPVVTSAGTVEPDETRLLAAVTSTEFGVPVGSAASGPGPPQYLHDLVHQIHRFEFSQPPELVEAAPDDLGRVLRDTAAAAIAVHAAALSALGEWAPGGVTPPGLALVGHELRYYDGAPFLGRPDGTVERGAHVRTEVLIGTDATLEEALTDPGAGAGAGRESRRPAYLGGPLPLPPGAPDGFGGDLGYRRRQAGIGPHQTGYYADTLRQRYDIQATGDPPRGWAAWPRFGVLIGDQDALGHTRTVEPDRYWLLTEAIRDAAGLMTTATYDEATLLPAVVVDPNGTTTRQRYTPLGLPRARWWSGPGPWAAGAPEPQPDLSYAYDLHAFYRTQTDPLPTPVHVHVTERVGPILPDGTAETLEWRDYYDGLGRLVQRRTQAEELGFAGADGAGVGLPADISAAPGPATGDRATGRNAVSGWRRFDSKGRVAAQYEPFFSTGWDYQPERDAAVGVATQYGYDPRGHLVLTLGPDGTRHREVSGYPVDEDDLALTAAEAAGAWPHAFRPTPWETYSFDPNDLAAVSADPGTGGSLADRAPAPHLATPASRLVDALGRVIFEVLRAGPGPQDRHGTRTAHDLRGNVLAVIDALGRTVETAGYDLLDRRLRGRTADGGLTTVVLDAAGNCVESRDAAGAIVLRTYDALHRLTGTWARDTSAAPAVTRREAVSYGDEGTPAQDPAVRAAQRARFLLGRVREHRDEAGLVVNERYDARGNLTERYRRVFSDAALGRLPPGSDWGTDWGGATTDADLADERLPVSREYDAVNRPISVTGPPRPDGGRPVWRVQHSRAGTVRAVSLDGQPIVSFAGYDAKGQPVLIQYGNGVLTRHAYDPRTFRLVRSRSERSAAGTAPDRWAGEGPPLLDQGYRYDLAGNPVEIEERGPNVGIRGNPDAATEPDPARRQLLLAGGTLVRRFRYDAMYRLTGATGRAAALPRSFEDIPGWGAYQTSRPPPDAAAAPHRTEHYTEEYRYDGVGNLRQLTYTVRGQAGNAIDARARQVRFGLAGLPPDSPAPATNRLTSVVTASRTLSCGYDDRGNLTSQDLDRTHSYNHAGRMVGYRVQAGTTPTVEARYLYAADGSRVKKWVRSNGAVRSTVYVEDLTEYHYWRAGGTDHTGMILHVLDGRGRVAAVDVGERLPGDRGPARRYTLADHTGSVALVVDQTGAWTNREEYFPYGDTSWGGYARKRYRFGGRERDEESGLLQHDLRYYAPWLARWTTPDPAGPVDATNLYSFARGSPLRYADPRGTHALEVVGAAPGASGVPAAGGSTPGGYPAPSGTPSVSTGTSPEPVLEAPSGTPQPEPGTTTSTLPEAGPGVEPPVEPVGPEPVPLFELGGYLLFVTQLVEVFAYQGRRSYELADRLNRERAERERLQAPAAQPATPRTAPGSAEAGSPRVEPPTSGAARTAPGGETVGRAFSFPSSEITGEVREAAKDPDHHVWPHKFRWFFQDMLQLRIDDITITLGTEHHQALHKGARGGWWNEEWERWIDQHIGGSWSYQFFRQQAIKKAHEMIREGGIQGYPLHRYRKPQQPTRFPRR